MENFGLGVNEIILLVILASIWTTIWKGIALWHAARNGQKVWYVGMLVIQTLGLLEILYLVAFRPRPDGK